MKKILIIIIAVAFVPFVSNGSNGSKIVKSNRLTEEITSKNDSDWTPIGTTEIVKKVGKTAGATQTVQVYRNSNGDRAIKDGRYYHKIEENSAYGQFPDEDCFECRYRYNVVYDGGMWYTHGVVKQTYGSY